MLVLTVAVTACAPRGSADQASTSPTPQMIRLCQPLSDTATRPTSFCETPAQEAAGEVPIHSPTIPDSALLGEGFTLTAPRAASTITQHEAESIAAGPTGQVRSAILAEKHSAYGLPTNGDLVWVIDITPPGAVYLPAHAGEQPQRIQYEFTVLDATTGKGVTFADGQAPIPSGTPAPSGQPAVSPPTVPTGTPAIPLPAPSPS